MGKQSFSDKLHATAVGLQAAGAMLSAHVEGGDGDMPRSLPEGIEYLSGSVDEYLAKQEPQRYTHRNGETEPPTEAGWYFLKQHGNARWASNPLHPLVWVIFENHELTVAVWGKDTPVKSIKGRWWGPLTPPWEVE